MNLRNINEVVGTNTLIVPTKDEINQLKIDIVNLSYNENINYCPSALSMVEYLSILIPTLLTNSPDFRWVCGKPFGIQSYLAIYDKIGRKDLTNDKQEIFLNGNRSEFVYIEETLGNSFGVSIGLGLSNPSPIWLNVSDSVFQMGRVLEALPLLKKYNINILITIDGNRCTRSTYQEDTVKHYYITDIFEASHIPVLTIDLNQNQMSDFFLMEKFIEKDGPRVIYFHTDKGSGVKRFMEDPIGWHYKKISEQDYFEIIQELT